MRVEQATESMVMDMWAGIEAGVQQAKRLEEAAQALAAALYAAFSESVVLARVYVTVPFEGLPTTNQAFVRNLTESAGTSAQLQATTPVLSLIGSYGEEANWRDRRNSQGHIGIPLISAAFISAVPMIARLLHELGVPSDWIESHDSEMLIATIGRSTGLFYVENAAEAVDHEGRKIIVAQDFVSSYNVHSVFGTGQAYAGGQMLVIVVFCRELVSRAAAECFLPLTHLFVSKTAALVSAGSIFSQ